MMNIPSRNLPFKVVCADPPWAFQDKLPGPHRGAERNYQCLSAEEIVRFPLPAIADDAVLFLWRVASQQQAALDVARFWGFVVKTELVWLKKTPNGLRWFGMGRILRAEHEVCLVATRGHPRCKNHATRSTFQMDVDGLSAMVGRHSEKPAKFYEIVESLYDGPYLELFARKPRDGWTCLGNELRSEMT
jgi:N6-adenosine-specific RNA methylase IME4